MLERESISGGVKDPGVIVGALHARVQPEGLARKLAGVERAGVGQRAVGLALDVTLLLPLGEVTQGGELSWVLHPLDDLQKKIYFVLLCLKVRVSGLQKALSQCMYVWKRLTKRCRT